jgi:hypothetical protein
MSAKELEKKLDKIFSTFIRLKNADDNGHCKCVTCGKIHHWKDVHNGHFIPRGRKTTRFNEINCNPQCVYCNCHKHGQPDLYRLRLIEIYGKDEVERLEQTARMGSGYDSFWLQGQINFYKEKVKQLKKEKGV